MVVILLQRLRLRSVEEAMRAQSKSKICHQQRAERVIASRPKGTLLDCASRSLTSQSATLKKG